MKSKKQRQKQKQNKTKQKRTYCFRVKRAVFIVSYNKGVPLGDGSYVT